jgi:sugar phosphate isomerase/epimerase
LNKYSRRVAVSTWSLHRLLDKAALLDIPAQAAAHGIGRIEICHFHLPSTDAAYLAELKASLADSQIECLTLLIDEGDLTDPSEATRGEHVETIGKWIDVAGEIGAARARVIAGKASPDAGGEALRTSEQNLRVLARRASDRGVRVVTENWFALLDRPAEVIQLLDALDGEVGLLLDFGNWSGERKYGDLARIAPMAESTHAKGNYDDAGNLLSEDYARCLKICADAGFQGPHSLIFDAAGDEWTEIDKLRDFVLSAA